MKLKKLLPIAAVASTAAVVAPIVTSCGAGTTLDGTEIYVPKSAQAVMDAQHEKAGGYLEADAEKMYFSHINENSKIFTEDMLYTISNELFAIRAEVGYETTLDLELNVNVNYKNIVVDTTKKTMSFDITGSFHTNIGLFNAKVEKLGNSGSAVINGVIKLDNIHFTCKDMPYSFTWSTTAGLMERYQFLSQIAETTVVTGSMKGTYLIPGQGVVIFSGEELNLNAKDESKDMKTEIAKNLFGILSNNDDVFHMQNIKHKPE